jgi:hypothetical protein
MGVKSCKFLLDQGDAGADAVVEREADADFIGVFHQMLRRAWATASAMA